ncbi:MAG: peptide deformylase [Trueperella sp.]|uniref:peptide deformylase n=1 Tax=Trueperella sp. TaxID=2699835 RepID=UPI002A910952|nr:peptide deformylase [Trueperella sp.]MDY5403055.1 peptide deformylase [Trueperella sp.]
MTYRDIRVVGDPVLRTVCDPIRDITPGIKQLVEDLLENVDEEGRAGLAANQIGVSYRAFSWIIEGELGYILNPIIVELSEETQDGDEGCLSVPDLWFPATRAMYARAEGTDLDGKKVVVEGREIWGRLIQHEVDHLDGHLFLDRLDRHLRREAFHQLRENQVRERK